MVTVQPDTDDKERKVPWLELRDYVSESIDFYRKNPSRVSSEMLSGITISILKVPESVAFSYVAGVHPLQGLYGSFFMGIITGFLGGRPGMISGCAGALAVVIKEIMMDTGPFGNECPEVRREYLYFTMVLTGILQIICGLLRCSVLVKLIPKTAFLGFFNGLAVVIFMSQLETFQRSAASERTISSGCAVVDFGFQADREWYGLHERTTWLMLVHVAIVMTAMEALPKLPKINIPKVGPVSPARVVPPSLVGLILVMIVEWGIFRPSGWSTPVVRDVSAIEGSLPPWHIPDVPWGEWDTWRKCLPCAASLCAIGLVESVLTLQAVDQILDQQTEIPKKNQECLAQGLANLVSGFFNAMGGDAMIGQSTINVLNGAQGRLSAVTDATFLMLYIVLLSDVIEAVPTAGLAGILFIVVIHTFNWPSVAIIIRRALPLYMCATIIIVTVLSVLSNLAVGVGAGILWECVHYVWQQKDTLDVEKSVAGDTATYRVAGDVFFANSDDFNAQFHPGRDPKKVVANLANARLLDYSALFTLNALGRRYALLEKELTIEVKREDFDRYMAVCDEKLPESDKAREWFPTGAAAAIHGRVRSMELHPLRFQEFLRQRGTSDDKDERQGSKDSKGRRKSKEWTPSGLKEDPWKQPKAPMERAFSKDKPIDLTDDLTTTTTTTTAATKTAIQPTLEVVPAQEHPFGVAHEDARSLESV